MTTTYDDILKVIEDNDPAVTDFAGPGDELESLGFDPAGVLQHAREAAAKTLYMLMEGYDPAAVLVALYAAAFSVGVLSAKAQESVEA